MSKTDFQNGLLDGLILRSFDFAKKDYSSEKEEKKEDKPDVNDRERN